MCSELQDEPSRMCLQNPRLVKIAAQTAAACIPIRQAKRPQFGTKRL